MEIGDLVRKAKDLQARAAKAKEAANEYRTLVDRLVMEQDKLMANYEAFGLSRAQPVRYVRVDEEVYRLSVNFGVLGGKEYVSMETAIIEEVRDPHVARALKDDADNTPMEELEAASDVLKKAMGGL